MGLPKTESSLTGGVIARNNRVVDATTGGESATHTVAGIDYLPADCQFPVLLAAGPWRNLE